MKYIYKNEVQNEVNSPKKTEATKELSSYKEIAAL